MVYFERDHAWFASFAPAEDPEIVVVVLNEHSGFGASNAAPTASALIKHYFELKRQDAMGEAGAELVTPQAPGQAAPGAPKPLRNPEKAAPSVPAAVPARPAEPAAVAGGANRGA
jgi:penicillin-binding protein 2